MPFPRRGFRKFILGAGLVLVMLLLLVPPWVSRDSNEPLGHSPLFWPAASDDPHAAVEIDRRRQLEEIAVILVTTAVLWFALRGNRGEALS